MELRFYGATGTTTGSCHMIRANGHSVLLECGMYQGRRAETYALNRVCRFDPERVDAVVQSHAHIDHSGKLPVLVRAGFSGRIHATHGTTDLCDILLMDSANIQVKDAEHMNRERLRDKLRGERRGPRRTPAPAGPPCLGRSALPEGEVVPLYIDEDVRETMPLFSSHAYGAWFDAVPGMRFRFHDAGHILGSAWIEGEITEGQKVTRVVFTGDYGRPGQPILRDPAPLLEGDVVISESTYGNRSHPSFIDIEKDLGDAVARLARRGRGRLLVPVFAIGRAQNILYTLGHIFQTLDVGEVRVAVDSPLAIKAGEIVYKHPEYFDEEALSRYHSVQADARLRGRLSFTESVEESKALNSDARPWVVLSASGMMENGRILHHLAWHLSSPDTEVLIVGYQASHTLGRRLLDGEKEVNLLGNRHAVRATITPLLGFSAHADREGLLAALVPIAERARCLFLVHGENDQRAPFARELAERGFRRIEAPEDDRPYSF